MGVKSKAGFFYGLTPSVTPSAACDARLLSSSGVSSSRRDSLGIAQCFNIGSDLWCCLSPEGTAEWLRSYVSSYFHCVFSTKERRPVIPPDLRERLWPFLGGIARQNQMKALDWDSQ